MNEASGRSSDKTHHRQTGDGKEVSFSFFLFVEEVINRVIFGIIFFQKGKSLF